MCCNVLQCVAVCCSALQCESHDIALTVSAHLSIANVRVVCVLQCVAVCCSVLQCVAVCCSLLQCVAVRCSALQCESHDIALTVSAHLSIANVRVVCVLSCVAA